MHVLVRLKFESRCDKRPVGGHVLLVLTLCKAHPSYKLSLQWRHKEHDGVTNHQPHDCLLNRLFKAQIKEASKLRVTGLCAGNSPVTSEFPAQIVSSAEMFPFDDVITGGFPLQRASNAPTHYRVECPNYSAMTHPSKRIGTSRMVSHNWLNSEPILGRNNSSLDCLDRALAYRYYSCIEETWEHVSVQWQPGKKLCANCFMCWNPISNAASRVSRQLRHPLLCRVP